MILNKIISAPPDEGQHLAVLADISDLGKRNTHFGPKDQLRFKWFVQQTGKDARELSVISTYTKSLGQGANLVKAISDITGAPPADGFDTDSLIGANARLIIKHKTTPDGRVYANVIAILRPGKNDPKLPVPAWFKRSGTDDNKQPAVGAATAPPTAPQAPKPAAAPSRPELGRNLQSPAEPPEPAEWQVSDYDEATSFPAENGVAGENAA